MSTMPTMPRLESSSNIRVLRLLFVVLLFALASSQVARADSFSIGEFASYQAADWGDDTTAINLLENDFSVVYSSVGGVLIVGETTNFELVFSGSTALLNYLPSTGAPGPLDSTYVDPLTTSSGIFGGDVVAMALSVDFSAAGALAHPAGIPFGDLYLTGFDAPDTVRNLPALPGLDGMTASQLLTLDDTALGGGSTGGYSIADLAVITNFVSTAFDPDDNFLGFADAHLTTTNPNAGSGGNPTPTPEPSSLLLLASGLLALGMFRYWRRGWVLFFIVLFLSLASSRADRADTFSTGEFVSYGQAEWPSDPAAIYLIEANFSAMYGTFQIGGSGEGSGSYALYFSNPTALLTYLDVAAGVPGVLDASLLNPTSTSSGVFGVDVIALQLDVDFSNLGLLPHPSGTTFGDLVLYGLTGNVAGLNGLNVSQVLPIEELALGGASTGYSVIDLDALGADLDLAFSLGVDTPFAQDHLELPTTTPPTPTPEPSSLLLLASGLLALGMIGYWQRRGMLFFVVLLLALASSQVARADTWSPGDFTTYNELEWGDVPAPGNAASILQNNYNVVYTPELDLFTVGLPSPGFSMQFTSYDTLLVYLPALGTPGALNSNVVDPDSTSSGEFGAGVATLRLNIDFSDAGLLPNHFGDLYLTGFDPSLSQLNSLTLRQFEGDLNIALSGESTIYGITDLDSIAADINESFDPAVGDLTFADDHLTATNPNGNGNPVTTPEPSSLLLLTSGLLALWTFRCWRRGSAIPN